MGAIEALVVISGVVIAIGFLIVPAAPIEARLTGLAVGALFVGYGIYVSSQSSGIFLIPVAAPAIALVTIFMTYQGFSKAADDHDRQRPSEPRAGDDPQQQEAS